MLGICNILNASNVRVFSNLKFVVNQIRGELKPKGKHMVKHLAKVKESIKDFL